MLLTLGSEVQGQVTPDDTVNTRVTTADRVHNITGGIEAGQNLFHSFEQFSLLRDEVANFDHSLDIEHIFGRVTGGSASTIDGLIQTHGDTGLFLINPAGIIFGADAQLDVGGSFVVSTGDSLIFTDGIEFSAVAPEVESLLTVSAPVGLQYGRAGAIEVLPHNQDPAAHSDFALYPGNTLALLGGDVDITSTSLNTLGSDVEIASVKRGTVGLQTSDRGWRFDYQDTEQLGKIDFSDLALINSSGRVNLQGETIAFSARSGIIDFNEFGETDNNISLTAAKSIEIDDSFLVTQVGQTNDSIEQPLTGRGGDVTIMAPEVAIANGSVISAGTLSQGGGGSITINASDRVRLSGAAGGNPSFISTSTLKDGLGGSIDIDTGRLMIDGGSQVQAFAGTDEKGSGGRITVNASQAIKLSGTGVLQSQSVDADGELAIIEKEFASGFSASSGNADLAIDAEGQSQGESGSLTINTPRLSIADGAEISVDSYGLANAGNVEIMTSNLSLDTAGQIVANTASGAGGSIRILATESIILDDRSSILTTAAEQGNGGNIVLDTANLVLLDFNRISANAIEGNGGNITIDTQGLFINSDSSITASSQIETKQGSVEISTLDLSSRIATDYRDRSSLGAEDKITSGCGAGIDLGSNQIRNVGRGGMPGNPFREVVSSSTLTDWGDNLPTRPRQEKQHPQTAAAPLAPIVEISGWVVNARGKVELVAQSNRPEFTENCSAAHSSTN
ncbi:MAG: filamentous hemagglutinin N-terminal domain-containing protein [Cyanobacteria bacterium J06623_7]